MGGTAATGYIGIINDDIRKSIANAPASAFFVTWLSIDSPLLVY